MRIVAHRAVVAVHCHGRHRRRASHGVAALAATAVWARVWRHVHARVSVCACSSVRACGRACVRACVRARVYCARVQTAPSQPAAAPPSQAAEAGVHPPHARAARPPRPTEATSAGGLCHFTHGSTHAGVLGRHSLHAAVRARACRQHPRRRPTPLVMLLAEHHGGWVACCSLGGASAYVCIPALAGATTTRRARSYSRLCGHVCVWGGYKWPSVAARVRVWPPRSHA